jgi:hypothetical protein
MNLPAVFADSTPLVFFGQTGNFTPSISKRDSLYSWAAGLLDLQFEIFHLGLPEFLHSPTCDMVSATKKKRRGQFLKAV